MSKLGTLAKSMLSKPKTFKTERPFEERLAEFKKISAEHKGRVPVIVEKDPNSDVPSIDKRKYLVPEELTMGQLLFVVRKRIKLKPEQAIFAFIGDRYLPPTSAVLGSIYSRHKDKDGFLYVKYSGENTFG